MQKTTHDTLEKLGASSGLIARIGKEIGDNAKERYQKDVKSYQEDVAFGSSLVSLSEFMSLYRYSVEEIEPRDTIKDYIKFCRDAARNARSIASAVSHENFSAYEDTQEAKVLKKYGFDPTVFRSEGGDPYIYPGDEHLLDED